MKTKLLFGSLFWVLVSGISAQSSSVTDQPQVVHLDANTHLTLLGVTYGRKHVAPGFEHFGGFNPIYGADDTTVVWIQVDHELGKWPSFELVVYDKAETACVFSEPRSRSHIKDGVEVHGFILAAYPRWEKEFVARAKYYDHPVADGRFVISNPHPVALANWTAESLPSTKSDGDFEVTLKRLSTGAPVPYWQGRTPTPTNDLAEQCVRLDFDFRQNGQPATNWFTWMEWTTDAAGNHVKGAVSVYPPNGIYPYPPTAAQDGYFYRTGLWPNEPWKVRLEFTRSSGFDENEIVTFTNVPVRLGAEEDFDAEWSWNGQTNFTFIPAEANGIHLKLLPALVYPVKSMQGQKHMAVLLYADPNPTLQGMRLKLLEATDDQGREVATPFNPDWAGHFSLDFPNPREDIKTVNLKFALHKGRFVEFTAKPTRE